MSLSVADFLEHHAVPHGPPHGGRGWAKKVGRVAKNTGLSRKKARLILKARKGGAKNAGKFQARVLRNMKKTGVDRATARKQVVAYKQAHGVYTVAGKESATVASFLPLGEHNIVPHGPPHGGRKGSIGAKNVAQAAQGKGPLAGKSNAEQYAAGTKNTAEHRALGVAAMVDRSRITYGRHIAKHAPDVAGPAGKMERGEPLSIDDMGKLHAAVDRLKAANKYNGSGEKAARAAINASVPKKSLADMNPGQTGSAASARAAAAKAGFVGIVRRNDPKLAKLYGGKDKIPPAGAPLPDLSRVAKDQAKHKRKLFGK